MKKSVKITGAVFGMVLAAAIGVSALHSYAKDNETIYEGIYVGNVNLSGMSKEDAQEEVAEFINQLLNQEITLMTSESQVMVYPEEIGLTWENTELAQEAFGVGRSGNLIKRYKDQQDLKHENIVLKPSFTFDETKFEAFIKEHEDVLNQETIDNGLKRENGNFVFIPGQEGTSVDVKASAQALREYFANDVVNGFDNLELVCKVEQPRGSEEELALVKDVLGSYRTDYSTSAPGRCTNVENATGFINGTVIYPGETFSVHDTISPITLSNGYDVAGAYENGTVVESVGGGVCQVSSTLYNAIIRAEIEVVERFPHSMVVSYVEPSQDAAIAGDYKDFKFKNNLEHPIYIEGYTSGKQVYFNVYGVETRDPNRVVTFETEIESTNEPDNKYNKVDVPIGHVVKLQGAHIGYKAVLYKIVTVNGKEESREIFNRSTYSASPAIYEVGIASDNKEAVKAIKAAIKTGDLNAIKEAASYWSASAIADREKEEEKNHQNQNQGENQNAASNSNGGTPQTGQGEGDSEEDTTGED